MTKTRNRPIVAIIPARGGSKSIPRKNIKTLGGAPLIAYSIAAGLQAQKVDRVIVSTDDEEIAAIARNWGADVPFLRPAALADDHVTDLPVFEHALSWLDENEDYHPAIVIQLRPTSPLRPPDCVDNAITILHSDTLATSVRGVVLSGQNPYKMWKFSADGYMRPLLDEGLVEPYNLPRQQLPTTYWQTGHIDAIRADTITQTYSMSGEHIRPLLLDPRYAIDIDTQQDWERAEWRLSGLTIPIVRPVSLKHGSLADIELLVLDFDGVMTDNRVWVNADGGEMIAANRGDGMGISQVRKSGLEVVVLSRETNPVVSARCRKLGIACQQGVMNKAPALHALMNEYELTPNQVAYVGNDINDIECLDSVGVAVAVADAHPKVLSHANIILSTNGGHGAVREFCDMILAHKGLRPTLEEPADDT
ncbi:MAG: acylneuraminate cytidylyltransferase [Chloroflexi bacterium]|nr:acylneuraminate cytidylyltransferase [Chloroflexota bacterium]